MPVTHLCRKCRKPRGSCEHGNEGRLNSYRRGYGGKRFLWEHPICAGKWSQCEKARLTTPAVHVDHEIPVSGADDPRFWNNEFNPLCDKCHQRKTRLQSAMA
jgi:5-methylcytosine-specific restriction protein A